MVQVRQQPILDDGSIDIDQWMGEIVQKVSPDDKDREMLVRACVLARELECRSPADHHWAHTASSFSTGLEMAQILADLHLDCRTLVAAVLYRSVREQKTSLDAVREEFGETVAKLIEGVLRMAVIGSLQQVSEGRVLGQTSTEQIDNLRRMLIAIIDDVRVALIKVAERTCAIRAVKEASEEKRRKVAREVADVYAPLAHRLGIGHIKWELEDLSFRYLEPDAYKRIASLLDEKRISRQQYIDGFVSTLQTELTASNIQADIGGRAKHIYSIWRKMNEKGIGFSQVYDIRAVRILVTTVHECYMVLGIVHSLWRTIPNEFDDYIARPKENGYRSLHTAVIGPENKVVEIQIRTQWMHEEAEYGVCAHWQYKTDVDPDGASDAGEYEQKVEWLRQVLEWLEESGGDAALVDELGNEIVHRQIYIFTPDGHVVELPDVATPLDFAYYVHTEVGHRCRGARVNGKVVPLNTSLKTGDQVEIITGKHEAPNREWLSEGMGYVTTARARTKIRQWFRQLATEQSIVDGSVILDREFKRLAMEEIDLEGLAKDCNLDSVADLHAAIGSGELDLSDVLRVAQKREPVLYQEQQLSFDQIPEKTEPVHSVIGVGNLPVHFSDCCHPITGDSIIGLIDGGKEAVIHRQDCAQFLQCQSDRPEQVIKVGWGDNTQSTYQVDLIIEAWERVGLLRDITDLLDRESINIVRLLCETDMAMNTVSIQLTVEIKNLNVLSLILAQLSQMPNIYTAERRR